MGLCIFKDFSFRIRDAHLRLDLMRVALDGAFSWVQLMLMLTYHDELVEALAMKILRERNSELMNQSDSNLGPVDPVDLPPASLAPEGPEFYASPREVSDSGRVSLASAVSPAGSEGGEPGEPGGSEAESDGSDGSGGSGGKRAAETAESPPVKEELWVVDECLICLMRFFYLHVV